MGRRSRETGTRERWREWKEGQKETREERWKQREKEEGRRDDLAQVKTEREGRKKRIKHCHALPNPPEASYRSR